MSHHLFYFLFYIFLSQSQKSTGVYQRERATGRQVELQNFPNGLSANNDAVRSLSVTLPNSGLTSHNALEKQERLLLAVVVIFNHGCPLLLQSSSLLSL